MRPSKCKEDKIDQRRGAVMEGVSTVLAGIPAAAPGILNIEDQYGSFICFDWNGADTPLNTRIPKS